MPRSEVGLAIRIYLLSWQMLAIHPIHLAWVT